MRELLRKPVVQRQILVLTLTNTGSWAALIALWALAAFKLHSEAGAVALVALAWSVPSTILGKRPGTWIERYGLRRVIFISQIIGASSSLSLAFCTQWSQVAAGAFVLGLSRALGLPAMDLLPAADCEDRKLLSSNSLYALTNDVAMIAGSIVAMILLNVSSVRNIFLLDTFTYLAAILALLRAKDWPIRVSVLRTTSLSDQSNNRQVVRKVLCLMFLVYISWSAFLVIEPLYVKEVLNTSSTTFAVLQMCYAVATVTAAVLAPRLIRQQATLRLLCGAVVFSGISCGVYVGTTSLSIAFVGIVAWGVSNSVAVVTSRTLLQLQAQQERSASQDRMLYGVANVSALIVLALAGNSGNIRATGFCVACLVTLPPIIAYWWAERGNRDTRRAAANRSRPVPQAALSEATL